MPEQDQHLSDEERRRLIASTRRFDLRRILGALFLLYGVLVTAVGLIDPAGDVKHTKGIPINLWTGVAMLLVGGLFLLWDRLAPVPEEDIVHSLEAEEDASESAAEADGRAR